MWQNPDLIKQVILLVLAIKTKSDDLRWVYGIYSKVYNWKKQNTQNSLHNSSHLHGG